MSDEHVVDRLSEYLNGELPAAESSSVSEHVLRCRQCREELEVMRVGAAAAHELPAHRAPDGLWEKLEARLESPPEPAAAVPARGRWLRPWALAAGVLLGGFVFGHWLQTGMTSPYRSVLIGSAVCIVLGFLLGVLALIADMMKRQRCLLEELVYLNRNAHWRSPPGGSAATAQQSREVAPCLKQAT